jgi:hypothetical protein
MHIVVYVQYYVRRAVGKEIEHRVAKKAHFYIGMGKSPMPAAPAFFRSLG